MIEQLFEVSNAFFRDLLGPTLSSHYGIIKFIHLMAVIIWSASAIGGFYYVVVASRESRQNRDDEELGRRYEWTRWHFNNVVILEHVSFIVILPTGLILAAMFNWNQDIPWLYTKMVIVVFVFIPMEIMDITLAHFLVPRAMLGRESNPTRYRKVMKFHDRFLLVTSFIVAVTVPWVVYLAAAKPG